MYPNKHTTIFLYATYILMSTLVNLFVRLASTRHSWQSIFLCKTFVIAMLMLFFVKCYKKEKMKFNLEVFMVGCLSGLTAFMWYWIVILVPMNTSMILSFLLPISVSIFGGLMLKEKITIHNIVKLLISFFCAIFTLRTSIDLHFDKTLILIFVLISLRVVYSILQKTSIRKVSNVALNLSQQSLFESFFIGLFMFAKFEHKVLIDIQKIALDRQAMIYVMLIASLSILGKLLYIFSFKKSSQISHLQVLDFLKLPFSMILSYFILKEKTTIPQLISGMLIICVSFSDFYMSYFKSKYKKFTKPQHVALK